MADAGTLRIDPANQCLWRGMERLEVTPKAFQVLGYLSERPERLVTKQELLEAAWPGTHVGEAVLSVAITQLRELLGDHARSPAFIETVHRRGYRWIGPALIPAPPPPPAAEGATGEEILVGRQTELDQLNQALGRARNGQRQIVFVSGDAGIGKTALLDQFLKRLGVKGLGVPLLVARGQCLEHFGVGEAYLPWIEVLGRLLRDTDSAEVATILRQHAPTWYVQLPWLLSDADRESLRQELAGATRERMLRELAGALEVLTRQSALVLVFEDLHWSDPSTVALLAMIAQRREPARLLLVGSFRPVDALLASHPINDLKRQLVGRGSAREISLPLLGPSDVRLYLSRRYSSAVAGLLANDIFRRTDGNPLFVVNLLEHLVSHELLRQRGGSWLLDPSAADLSETPESVRQMIEQMADRLDRQDALMLAAASVVGMEISAPLLAAALNADAGEVDSRCELLARRGAFLRRKSAASSGPRYEFRHALYQRVLYERIAPARRMQSHRRVVDWLADHDGSPAELLHHMTRAGAAGEPARLAQFARRAAERARAVFAFDEAIAHYRTALAALPADSSEAERCLLMIAAGEALERGGQIAMANRTFLDAAALGRRIGDPRLLARSALGLGRAYQQVGQTDSELIELLEDAAGRLADDEPSLRARVLARLTWALCAVAGSAPRRQQLSEQALALARQCDDPETLVWVFQYTRWAMTPVYSAEQLQAGTLELAALCERVVDKEQLLMLRVLRATDLLEIGDRVAAEAERAVLRDLVEETQIPWFRWFLGRMETVRALLEGRLDDAERLASSAVAAAEGMDHPNVLPLFAAQTVMLRWQQQRLDEAEAMAKMFIEHNPAVAAWRSVRAAILCELGRKAEAAGEFELLAAHDFADIAQDNVWLNTIAALALVCAELKDRKRAAILFDLLSPYSDRCIGLTSNTFALGHACRYLALLAATLGRPAKAKQLFERALSGNQRLSAHPWTEATRRDQQQTRR